MKLNKTKKIEDEIIEHPKKTIYITKKEKVLKRVKVYSDIFEMNGYNYGNVRVIKVIEENNNTTNEMYVVTTLVEEDLEFLVDVMHRRWDIELNGFRKLKNRYNLDHLYVGNDNVIRLISYLIIIVYNLIELYFNIHTKN